MPTYKRLQEAWRWDPHARHEITGGPVRIYDRDAADPDYKPRPVGFTAEIEGESDVE